MTGPLRIQLRRTKGWRKPPNTVIVSRPSKWGNPYTVVEVENRRWMLLDHCDRGAKPLGISVDRRDMQNAAAGLFRLELAREGVPDASELRGLNLACWCRLCDAHRDGKPLGVVCKECEPCHADVLLEVANS